MRTDDDIEKRVLVGLEAGPMTVDKLAKHISLSTLDVLPAVARLHKKGRVREMGAGRYGRADGRYALVDSHQVPPTVETKAKAAKKANTKRTKLEARALVLEAMREGQLTSPGLIRRTQLGGPVVWDALCALEQEGVISRDGTNGWVLHEK